MVKYRGAKRLAALPPHIFALAERAYVALTMNDKNQSMLCCGESGSGKTEATKLLMKHLASVNPKVETKKSSEVPVQDQVIAADRKSGSAGMPRPISYAVFCLKKKNY
eukprot:TRINITY_DN22498_c0_g1_i17.p1 TRINITY_DN22498_c0_g1~~TRINITY_DN22498_c0_g1_i17.p1  ORF type:complete len:108 (-),score=13.85 TRINITY_DN22498_c0_g1_i17:15-338(-)